MEDFLEEMVLNLIDAINGKPPVSGLFSFQNMKK